MVVHIMNTRDKQESLTLELLQAIESRSDVTQRRLAKRMDVALGLANSYLKRCVRKGWVKIHQAPANRYLYYLTPTGFSEKSRLTAQYLAISFSFYRKASESCAEIMRICALRNHKRVVLCGVSDLAEIASLRALENEVQVVGVYDQDSDVSQFLDKEISRRLNDCHPFDVALVTDLTNPQATLDQLLEVLPPERVVVPSILGLNSP